MSSKVYTEGTGITVKHDEAIWEQVLSFDLSIVTATFAERNEVYGEQAEMLELECKRFMYLAVVAPDLDLAPTKPIDEYWHQFMMFTILYADFCEQFANEFVHHNPLAGPNHEELFVRTQRMAVALFGQFENKDTWFLPRPATSCRCRNPRERV